MKKVKSESHTHFARVQMMKRVKLIKNYLWFSGARVQMMKNQQRELINARKTVHEHNNKDQKRKASSHFAREYIYTRYINSTKGTTSYSVKSKSTPIQKLPNTGHQSNITKQLNQKQRSILHLRFHLSTVVEVLFCSFKKRGLSPIIRILCFVVINSCSL